MIWKIKTDAVIALDVTREIAALVVALICRANGRIAVIMDLMRMKMKMIKELNR